MLVLTRKADEEIKIGENVTVKVVAVTAGRVRIGIEAPPDVRIERRTPQPKESHGVEKV